jgi:hypothetical protein
MKRALMLAALVACGLITARCATEGAAGDYYDPYYYDDPWYGYGYGFGFGVVVGGCCDGDMGPPPHPEHPIANPPGGDRPGARPEHPIANPPSGATPKADTRPAGGSSSSRPMPSPRSAAPSRGFSGGGGRGGGGRR